jgi:hypothetical protein
VDFDQQTPACKRTIVNKIIKDHFGWALHGREALLVIEEPGPIDYSSFDHFKVPTALIDTYIYHRAGFGLKTAIWVAPQSSKEHPHSDYDNLVRLGEVGLMLRGGDIPREIVLSNYLKDSLVQAVQQLTGRQAASKTKAECIKILLDTPNYLTAPALLGVFRPRCQSFPLEWFFFANPRPEGFTEEQTWLLGASARFHECIEIQMRPQNPDARNVGSGKRICEATRHRCCILCATDFKDATHYPFHPGCTCEPEW